MSAATDLLKAEIDREQAILETIRGRNRSAIADGRRAQSEVHDQERRVYELTEALSAIKAAEQSKTEVTPK